MEKREAAKYGVVFHMSGINLHQLADDEMTKAERELGITAAGQPAGGKYKMDKFDSPTSRPLTSSPTSSPSRSLANYFNDFYIS